METSWRGKSKNNDGRHLLYTDATSRGDSVSPLYHFDPETNNVNVTAIHVGDVKAAVLDVPLRRHSQTIDKSMPHTFTEHTD